MVNLVESIEEVAEAVIVEEDAGQGGEGASGRPVIFRDGFGVAVVSLRVILVEEDDVKLLVEEVVGLM